MWFLGTRRPVWPTATTEKIGKIVNQKMDVEVLSYDPVSDRIVPRKVVNWFNNGQAEQFLQFTVDEVGRQRQVAVRRDAQPPDPDSRRVARGRRL